MKQDIPKTQNTMEDGVTETPNMFPPMNQNSQDGSKREDAKEKEGFVSTEKDEKMKQEEEGKDSSGGGGVISNLISTFITPSSPRTEKVTTQDESGNEVLEKKEEVDNNGGEKGIISNLVTNFFHKRECEEVVVEKEEEEIKVDEKIKRLKTENEANGGTDNGGGGFIHDIVSHLPGKNNKLLKTKGSFCKILYYILILGNFTKHLNFNYGKKNCHPSPALFFDSFPKHKRIFLWP
jgi:hypothetical protein